MPIGVGGVGNVASNPISATSGGRVQLTKESSAAVIGYILVAIFGFSVLSLFHLGALLFTKFNAVQNQDFAAFVRDALNPFLKECATTLGTIFGSTLGFVLGYYFKEASNSASSSSD